jgi:hypothetical protein
MNDFKFLLNEKSILFLSLFDIKLDDAVLRQSVIAGQKSLETLKTQLNFAKDLFNRQNNL